MAPRKLTARALVWRINVIDTKAVLKKGRPCGGPLRIDFASLPGPMMRELNRQANRVLDERERKTDK